MREKDTDPRDAGIVFDAVTEFLAKVGAVDPASIARIMAALHDERSRAAEITGNAALVRRQVEEFAARLRAETAERTKIAGQLAEALAEIKRLNEDAEAANRAADGWRGKAASAEARLAAALAESRTARDTAKALEEARRRLYNGVAWAANYAGEAAANIKAGDAEGARLKLQEMKRRCERWLEGKDPE